MKIVLSFASLCLLLVVVAAAGLDPFDRPPEIPYAGFYNEAVSDAHMSRFSHLAGPFLPQAQELIKHFDECPHDDYLFLDSYGQGTYGVVYKALHYRTGRVVAVKVFDLLRSLDSMPTLDPSVSFNIFLRSAINELYFSWLAKSPHSVSIYDSYIYRYYVCVVFEAGELGSLNTVLDNNTRPLSMGILANICKKMVEAVAAVHAKDVLHLDVGVNNCVLSPDETNMDVLLKLIDFGLSEKYSDSPVFLQAGAPCFGAPECRPGHPNVSKYAHSPASDVYSIAATLVYLFAGGPDRYTIYDTDKGYFIHDFSKIFQIRGCSPTFRALIEGCTAEDPRLRWSLQDILNSQFIKDTPFEPILSENCISALLAQDREEVAAFRLLTCRLDGPLPEDMLPTFSVNEERQLALQKEFTAPLQSYQKLLGACLLLTPFLLSPCLSTKFTKKFEVESLGRLKSLFYFLSVIFLQKILIVVQDLPFFDLMLLLLFSASVAYASLLLLRDCCVSLFLVVFPLCFTLLAYSYSVVPHTFCYKVAHAAFSFKPTMFDVKSKHILSLSGYTPVSVLKYWEVWYSVVYVLWFWMYKQLPQSSPSLSQMIRLDYDKLSGGQRLIVLLELQPPKLLLVAMMIGHVAIFLICRSKPEIAVMNYMRPSTSLEDTKYILVQGIDHYVLTSMDQLPSYTTDPPTYSFVYDLEKYVGVPQYPNVAANKKFFFQKLLWDPEWSLNDFLGYQGLSLPNDIEYRQKLYGKNVLQLPDYSFLSCFLANLSSPAFVYSLIPSALHVADGLDMSVAIIFTLVSVFFQFLDATTKGLNLQEVRTSTMPKGHFWVTRNNVETLLPSENLVPGDLIRLTAMGPAPCDMILVSGECRIVEPMVTGESLPVQKVQLQAPSPDTIIDLREIDVLHGESFIASGTQIVYAERYCMAVVIRTGSQTSTGKLTVKSLMPVSESLLPDKNAQVFTLLSVVLGALFSLRNTLTVLKRNPYYSKLLLGFRTVKSLIASVPSFLLQSTKYISKNAALSLRKQNIYCVDPSKLLEISKIDVCCFDKTGTLTVDAHDFCGVFGIGLPDAPHLPFDKDALARQYATRSTTGYYAGLVLGTCHFLTKDVDNKMHGDPLELAALEASPYNFFAQTVVTDPKGTRINMVRGFDFNSSLERMSVVVEIGDQLILTCKGSPEVLLDLICDPSAEYGIYKDLAAKGYRVLALAYKILPNNFDWRSATRDAVETDMVFCGFVAFNCPLKPDSAAVVQELLSTSHKVVMITGDYYLTSSFTAEALSLYRDVADPSKTDSDYVFIDYSNNMLSITRPSQNIGPKRLVDPAALDARPTCISGSAFSYLLREQREVLVSKILPNIAVACRFKPGQKEALISLYQAAPSHLCVSMVGDGANDTAALRKANLGVAICNLPEEEVPADEQTSTNYESKQEAAIDASTAAPFIVKHSSLSSFVTILKFCRAARVCLYMLYKNDSFATVVTLVNNMIFSNIMAWPTAAQLFLQLLLHMLSFLVLSVNPATKLSNESPPEHFATKKNVISMIVLILWNTGLLYATYVTFRGFVEDPQAHMVVADDPDIYKAVNASADFSPEELQVPDDRLEKILALEYSPEELASIGLLGSAVQSEPPTIQPKTQSERVVLTVYFFVGTVLQLVGIFLSYDGAPFMPPIYDLVVIRNGLILYTVGLAVLLTGYFPALNNFFSFEFPNGSNLTKFYLILAAALFGPLTTSFLITRFF